MASDIEFAREVVAAEWYERDWVPAMLSEWASTTASAAEVAIGHRVLDVGCGTGVVARECAHRAGTSGSVTGLDASAAMLTVARSIGPDIKWHQGSAESLPFSDGSFDRVVSQFALMFFIDRVQAVREMWRVLAPGGRLAVTVSGPVEATPPYEALVELIRQHLGDVWAEDVGGRFVLGDPSKVRSIFNSAQIEHTTVETLWGTERFPSPAGFVEAEIRSSAQLADLFDDDSLAALLVDANESMGAMADHGGRFTFSSPAHVVTAAKPATQS